jgi:hypothetical protein
MFFFGLALILASQKRGGKGFTAQAAHPSPFRVCQEMGVRKHRSPAQSENPKNGLHENNRFHFISALSIESS